LCFIYSFLSVPIGTTAIIIEIIKMSSIIFINKIPTGTGEYIKLLAVKRNRGSSSPKEDLSDYVRRILKEKNLTLRQVEQNSRLQGNKITHSYLSKILSRAATNPSSDKIQALAIGLGVHPSEVYQAAGEQMPVDLEEFKNSELAVLFFKSLALDEEGKQELRTIIRWAHARVDELIKQGKVRNPQSL
jgi:transcriptional regulator with XRE-family HTH domain